MSMMHVRSMEPGERSLPAELRTHKGNGFASRRLANGMRGVSGISGMRGIGEGDTSEEFTPPVFVSNNPVADSGGIFDSGLLTGNEFNPCGSGVLVDGICQTSLNNIASEPYTPPSNWSGPTSVPKGATAPAPPSGYQWVAAANGVSQNLAKILSISQGGTVMQMPNGQQIITGSPGANVGLLSTSGAVGQISQYLPYLLMAGAAMLFLSFSRGR